MAVIHLTRTNPSRQNARAGKVQANLEAYDRLSALLMHLESQVAIISADGLASFDAMSDANRRNYLWAMAESITTARELCDGLEPAVFSQHNKLRGSQYEPGSSAVCRQLTTTIVEV